LAEKRKREIVSLQVALHCDKNCEPCPRYFDCTSEWKQDIYKMPALRAIKKRLSTVKHKIAVLSGKGGVGKSTTLVNLAGCFAQMGFKVGALDSDFYEPTLPSFFGIPKARLMVHKGGILPIESPSGVKVASVASTLEEYGFVTWVTDQLRWGLYTFLGGTDWGDLDVLFIDLPPGTGEECLNVLKALPDMDGVVIVTIPSDVSQIVVGRGISLCRRANTKIFGLVENMATFECPHCAVLFDVFRSGGGMRVADEMGVNFLGRIPLDSRNSAAADQGEIYSIKYKDTLGGKEYMRMAKDIIQQMGLKTK